MIGADDPLERAALAQAAWDSYCERRRAGRAEEVSAFLAAHAELRPLLEPLLTQAEAGGAWVPLAEDDFGIYRIVEPLGGGGMGEVFLAEQQEPVRRQVALKVVRAGIDSAPLLLRFAAERQALARMSHDGIAKVFDAGTSRAGRPYFVMEYVPGLPLTTWCDGEGLGLQARLELFLVVCAAVQHAHHKGVIHRDLKPSNVLIARQGDEAVPKIIDFGLARTIDLSLTEQTLHTALGTVMGTPEYMSPEQAQGRTDVDTRTDVYALGVLLYELLTGTLPFVGLRAAGPLEMQRRIVEEPPRAPSTRVSALGAAAAEPAARRGLPVDQLVRRLRGDLDKIVLKALAKEPAARYPTAEALAADVHRHLRGDPVEAVPPTLAYRLRKALRRNRGAVTVAAAIVVLLAGWARSSSSLYAAARQNVAAEMVARQHADQHLARFHQLAGVARLSAARAALVPIFPPWPAQASALESWLTTHATPLLAERPRLLQAIGALRSSRAGVSADWQGREADQFLHDVLVQLVEDLDGFAQREVAAAREDLAWARSVVARSIDAHGDRWRTVRAQVVAAPRYRGLDLAPQLGLVPLDFDPASGLVELYDLRSAEDPDRLPERDGEGRWRLDHGTGVIFVLLPGGESMVGAQRADSAAANFDPGMIQGEGPVRCEHVEPFLIAKFELTRAQWMRLSRGPDPSLSRDDQGAAHPLCRPVEYVTWSECERLLARQGWILPTESQWEYACRAGTDTPWYTGSTVESLAGHANLADRTAHAVNRGWQWEPALEDGWILAAPVGSFAANGFGLHDMVGNVMEWCRDACRPPTAEAGSAPQAQSHRAIRGGAFTRVPAYARSAARIAGRTDARDIACGVRPVRLLQGEQ